MSKITRIFQRQVQVTKFLKELIKLISHELREGQL
jgi:hypothetical protein